jgi:hypothetical protein
MMFIPHFQQFTLNIFIFHIIPWQLDCYVSKKLDITITANVKTLFSKKTSIAAASVLQKIWQLLQLFFTY